MSHQSLQVLICHCCNKRKSSSQYVLISLQKNKQILRQDSSFTNLVIPLPLIKKNWTYRFGFFFFQFYSFSYFMPHCIFHSVQILYLCYFLVSPLAVQVKDTVEESIYRLNKSRNASSFISGNKKNQDQPILTLKDVESLFAVAPTPPLPAAPDNNHDQSGSLMHLPPSVAAAIAAERRFSQC